MLEEVCAGWVGGPHPRTGSGQRSHARHRRVISGPPASDRSAAEAGWQDSWRGDALVVALVMVVVVAFNWLHVGAYQTLSPVDEFQHVDYLYKAGKGQMVGRGDLVGDEAMHEEACRGVDAPGFEMPCKPIGSYHPSQFQEGGQNTAYIHSPVYYFGTAWVGKAVVKATPIDNLFKAARLLGPMWVLPALLLMVPTMRRLGAGIVARIAAGILAVTFPTVLHATSTVNPDATALLGGALVLCAPVLLAGRWTRPGGRVVDGLAAAASMALKPSNLVVLIAGAWMRTDLSIGPARADSDVPDTQDRLRPGPAVSRSVSAVLPMLLGAGVVSAVMLVVQARLASSDPDDIQMLHRYTVEAFPWGPFAESFLSTGQFSAAGESSNYLAPFLRLPFIVVSSAVIAFASLVVTVAAALRSDRTAAMARSVLIATLLGGPALIAVNFILQGIFVYIPVRYYMSLIPGVVVVGAATVGRWRHGPHALAAVAVVWSGALAFALIAAQ